MKKGPHLVLYERTDTERISSIEFGGLQPDNSSQTIDVWLWNKKNFSDAPTATDVRICAQVIGDGVEGVDYDIYVKSDGVMDPDGTGIVDDAEGVFSSLGNSLTGSDTYHSIGDIPSNCARRLLIKIEIPQDSEIEGNAVYKIKVGYLSEPVKWLYVED